MAITPKLLRGLFLAAAVALVLTLFGYYQYERMRLRAEIKSIPKKLGIDVQQSASGFTFSKSVAGRMMFSVSADKAVQYKIGGRATLSNVRIVIYSADGSHFDQIFGKEFDYDQKAAEVTATGEVGIDLEAKGQPDPHDPAQTKGAVHLVTSGLSFDQKTGNAQTAERVEFSLPQASGSAKGAVYDSKAMALTLLSDIAIDVQPKLPVEGGDGDASGMKASMKAGVKSRVKPDKAKSKLGAPGHLSAASAVIRDQPREAVLQDAHFAQGGYTHAGSAQGARDFSAKSVTIALRDDNTVQQVKASGDVRASVGGSNVASNGLGSESERSTARHPVRGRSELHADNAVFNFSAANVVDSALLTGDVNFHSSTAGAVNDIARAQRVDVSFAGKNQVEKVVASGGAHFEEGGPTVGPKNASMNSSTNGSTIDAERVDLFFRKDQLDHAETSGPSELVLAQEAKTPTRTQTSAQIGMQSRALNRTVITAGKFRMAFAAHNRIRELHGGPDAKIVSSSAAGHPDRVTTSDELDVRFDEARGGVISATQAGNFHYSEGSRAATAERGVYEAADESLLLTGGPVFTDKGQGVSVSAETLRLDRKTGEASAKGDVKTTYLMSKQSQAASSNAAGGVSRESGALFGGSDPVHVTASFAVVSQKLDSAKYSGGVKLWQGANVVSAAVMEFHQKQRTLVASAEDASSTSGKSGQAARPAVETVFVQADRSGRMVPVTVRADKLAYSDSERRARFEGNVTVNGADSKLTCQQADIVLFARDGPGNVVGRGVGATLGQSQGSRLKEIIAQGNVQIVQNKPPRKGSGSKLIYTAADGRFELTGDPGKLPSIFDAEHGNVTGDSLTFYSRDDTVQVKSSEKTQTVTKTTIRSEKKP